MALGKNLKGKKLIEKEKPSKKERNKKVVSKSEKLIKDSKPKTTKNQSKKTPSIKSKVSKTKSRAKAKPKNDLGEASVLDKKDEAVNVGLPIYIAEEIHSLKKELRERYEKELIILKGKLVQFVVFQIGGESYALDIGSVKEVVPLPVLSKTPNTPEHIKGIANIRGVTYTVYDLASKFKITGDQLAKFLLVVSGTDIRASLMIGSLPTTLKVKGDDISGSMDMIEDATLDVSFIKGIIHNEEKLIYYLDVVALLKNDKAIVVPDKYFKKDK